MAPINHYRLAPTWLHNKEGETKLFRTQEEVDQAWEDGWFGPLSLPKSATLISETKFNKKQDMIDAVDQDPRYDGLSLSNSKGVKALVAEIVEFENLPDFKGD